MERNLSEPYFCLHFFICAFLLHENFTNSQFEFLGTSIMYMAINFYVKNKTSRKQISNCEDWLSLKFDIFVKGERFRVLCNVSLAYSFILGCHAFPKGQPLSLAPRVPLKCVKVTLIQMLKKRSIRYKAHELLFN